MLWVTKFQKKKKKEKKYTDLKCLYYKGKNGKNREIIDNNNKNILCNLKSEVSKCGVYTCSRNFYLVKVEMLFLIISNLNNNNKLCSNQSKENNSKIKIEE